MKKILDIMIWRGRIGAKSKVKGEVGSKKGSPPRHGTGRIYEIIWIILFFLSKNCNILDLIGFRTILAKY